MFFVEMSDFLSCLCYTIYRYDLYEVKQDVVLFAKCEVFI